MNEVFSVVFGAGAIKKLITCGAFNNLRSNTRYRLGPCNDSIISCGAPVIQKASTAIAKPWTANDALLSDQSQALYKMRPDSDPLIE